MHYKSHGMLKSPRSIPLWNGLALLAVALIAPGCATPVGVTKVGVARVYEQVNVNTLNARELSSAATMILHRYGLEDRFEMDPREVLATLHKQACKDHRRDLLFALSELSYFTADKSRRNTRIPEPASRGPRPPDPEINQDLYLASAVYAYLYLLGDSEEPPPSPYSREFRVACDLYNIGLARGLPSPDGLEILASSSTCQLPYGRIQIQATRPGFPWDEEHFSRFLPAEEYSIRGITHRNRRSGLGLPLIAIPNPTANADRAFEFLPDYLKIPATAFLRINTSVHDLEKGELNATLELYSAFESTTIKVGDHEVPIEFDTTAPLAYSLEEPRIWQVEITQFLSGEQQYKSGIYMLAPYQPGRIPVVFVHGTASSPARWSEMINTLQADPVLRERLQFWYFIYNTGNPTPYSASLLRESLRKIVHEVDPQGKDDAMQRMVVIGHSQGGLLTKLTAVESGDKFWRLGHKESIEETRLTDEQRDMLRTMLFYEPLPSVRRVVFLATPHHGVFLIKSFVQNLAGRLIKMPSNLLKLGKDVLKGDPALYPPELKHRYPTSIDTMSPRNPFLRTLASIPVAPGVKSHSIIPVRQNGDLKRGNDGVVKYTSAHIEPVDSELVVRDSHSCQGNPRVIEEVRGIMIEHLDWVKKGCP